ncbi:MAG: hypothetical protein IJ317_02120 [Clostridia bacterium]|nr:hypothetical protein [Clostridia bacterium]
MKIISFNSYKGGACRTTTCFNTVPYLAKVLGATKEKPLLIVDLDLDSMGMTKLIADGKICSKSKFDNSFSANRLFDASHPMSKKVQTGEILEDYGADYFSAWAKAGEAFGLEEGSVLFLGSDAYAKTITEEAFESMKNSSPLGDLITMLDYFPDENKPVGIIFDCAAGMQKTTQMALTYVDTSVVCMRPTEQFRRGTSQYLSVSYPKIFAMRNGGDGARNVILLPTSVAPISAGKETETYKKVNRLRDRAFEDIEDIVNYLMEERSFKVNASMVDSEEEGNMGIPEVERLKWKEDVPLVMLPDPTPDEKAALGRYEKLSSVIAGA